MLDRITRYRQPRLLAVLLALLLLLTACAKPPAESPKATYQGTIALWASLDLAGVPAKLPADWLDERAKAYEVAHPGVTVSLRLFPTAAELEQALLAGGEGPDLYFGRPLPLPADRLANLPLPAALLSDLPAGALRPFRQGEQVSGMPVLLDLQVLALNDKAFAAKSVPLPADGRWSAAEFAETLTKLSGNRLFGLGFSLAPGYHQWWGLLDGLVTPDGQIAPGAESGLTQLATWRKQGQLYPDIARLTTAESYQLFAANPAQIAILPIPAWAVPLLRGEPFQASVTIATFPGDQSPGYVYGFTALQQTDGLKLQAMADLVALLAPADQQVRLARATGLMPAASSSPNPFEGDREMSQAWAQVSRFAPLPAGPAWDQAQGAIAQELLYGLYGTKPSAEALQGIQTQFHQSYNAR